MNFKQIILQLPFVQKMLSLSQRIVPPGFQGVSLYEAGRFFVANMNNINLDDRSAAVTYNLLTALPSILLFFFTLVPYLPMQDVHITILTMLKLIVPNKATYDTISGVVNDFLNKEQRSLLSFSLLLTLFFSSNGMMAIMRYFDKDGMVYVNRSSFKRRWAAIKLTIMLMAVVLATIVVVILQTEYLNDLLLIIFGNTIVVRIFSLLLLFLIIFSAISFTYIYGPSLTHRFRFVSVGAIFASTICVLSSAIFFYAVNNFLNYNKIYGSIGSLIIFFMWLSINTKIILIGYDLNVSILMGRIHKEKEND